LSLQDEFAHFACCAFAARRPFYLAAVAAFVLTILSFGAYGARKAAFWTGSGERLE